MKVSALFHDSGFMLNAVNHEQIGCDMAKKLLPEFGYKEDEIDKICGMILATKFPQQPNTLLEEILCDADLDYLGRPDFFSIGNTLFEELKASKTLSTAKDWNQLQVNFLLTHKYFTRSAKELRDFQKEVHLQQIKTFWLALENLNSNACLSEINPSKNYFAFSTKYISICPLFFASIIPRWVQSNLSLINS